MKQPRQNTRVGATIKLLNRQHGRLARTAAVALAALTTAASLLPAAIATADNAPAAGTSPLVISEIQTGGCADDGLATCTKITKQEFVEIHNQRTDDLDVHGWQVRYLSSTGKTATVLATLDGVLAGHGFLLLAHTGFYTEMAQLSFGNIEDSGKLAESAGHVEIIDAQGGLVDRVGWGSSATLALITPATAAKAGQSIARTTNGDGTLANIANNAVDFSVNDVTSPRGGDYLADAPAPDAGPPAAPEPPTAAIPSCEGVVISELLPNPAGPDSDHEFIELHNPIDEVISLLGCSLQTSANSKTYALPDVSLQPDEYRSFSDTETSLSLPNSSGGTVWLLSTEEELNTVAYPANLPDDATWALADGSWAKTYTPTSGGANILTASEPCPTGQERSLETNRCTKIETATNNTSASALTPCRADQERNPETNRCRNVAGATNELAACKPGQTRSPITHRCATDSAAGSSSPAACKAGQERNPETNRCRNIAAAAPTKSCPDGQTRNAETNRCRKAAAAATNASSKVEDVKSPVGSDNTKWLIVGLAVVGAIGYAIYEWRQEISFKLRQWFRRPSSRLCS